MNTFVVATLVVALAELGDKTQLLALLLAARYRQPWPIAWGILIATVANHALAGLVGEMLAAQVSPETLRWLLSVSFLAMALWVLIPDRLDAESSLRGGLRGPFIASLIAFFLAEMGDKTQIATVALAASYESLLAVVAGSTLGMMLANLPVLWLGARYAHRIPLRLTRLLAAAGFLAVALWVLLSDL